MSTKIPLEAIKNIYDEFGLNIHSVPAKIQGQVNSLVKEVIKTRTKLWRYKNHAAQSHRTNQSTPE